MDYSYYTTAQAPYPFLGFTPDSNGTQQNLHSNGYSTTTAAPSQPFDAPFDTFNQNVYDTNNFVPPHFQHHRQSLRQSPAPSVSPSGSQRNIGHKSSVSEPKINYNNDLVDQNIASDPVGEEFTNRGRSSSEEKDSMTPAQSKRKAQNRAAQRAFRERKERHVKELEAKLNDLEVAYNSLHDENERLKREHAKVATENEILRATSASGPPVGTSRGGGSQSARLQDDDLMKTGPMKYTPTDFLAAIRLNHSSDPNSTTAQHVTLDTPTAPAPSSLSPNSHLISHNIPAPLLSSQGSFIPSAHRITISPLSGQRLLSAGATWDFIQAHPLSRGGLLDIADVSERLKGCAECDGTGPAFEEGRVRRAIEESAAVGRDELI